MKISHGGVTVGKCPLYPSIVWSEMNDKIAEIMLRFFDFTDETQYS